jgi:hypothetical protein
MEILVDKVSEKSRIRLFMEWIGEDIGAVPFGSNRYSFGAWSDPDSSVREVLRLGRICLFECHGWSEWDRPNDAADSRTSMPPSLGLASKSYDAFNEIEGRMPLYGVPAPARYKVKVGLLAMPQYG